jgi:two-component system chemotaxis sensor kinase CheA
MDQKREEFLARLRETFQVEAKEHIEAIAAGLLAFERAAEAERASIVESAFREAHSLKGAARSVNLAGVEAMCRELESLFAAVKRREVALSTEALDTIHPALRVLSELCGSPGAAPSPEGRGRAEQALATLQGLVRGPVAAPTSSPAAAAAPAASRASLASEQAAPASAVSTAAPAPSLPPDQHVHQSVAATSAPDTIRISTRKLITILLEVEELVGAKNAGSARSDELRAIVADLTGWNRRRARVTSRKRRGDEETAPSESLASEILYTRTLEHSLRTLAGAAHRDALALSGIADRLLEDTKKVLLLPCSYLLGTLPSIVRDLAREQGKEAEVVVIGMDIEIDRRVLDELKDPLIHLLRNCVDHGIERPDTRRQLGKPGRGSIRITARPVEGNRVELTVADDGSGIDSGAVGKAGVRMGLIAPDEASRLTEADLTGLVFHSGLSTSAILTDLSGRGLGLAIVREKVEELGGTIALTSTPGGGTAFRMLMPLSLATFRGVFVTVAGRPFVIPTASVVRVSRVRPDDIRTVENRAAIMMGGCAVALVRLRDVLELSGTNGGPPGPSRPVVLLHAADRQVAFLVDEVEGEQEVMVKKLGRQLVRVRNVAGACISGSGGVIPILDVADLVESAYAARLPASIGAAEDAAPERRGRLLIAEDSITSRMLVKSILEGAGYEVVASVDGMDAMTRLKSEPFDLLVSDVDMPRMNGFELTARIRADTALHELPVVLVTALGSQKDQEYGIEVGANAYIVKSDFDQSNLVEIIRRLL